MDDNFRRHLANKMVTSLPAFGTWSTAINEFETPYGKAGYRQLELLWAIRHGMIPGDAVTPGSIAKQFQVQPSVVTRLLAKLEANGFVRRVSSATDGRSFQVEITDLGIDLSKFVEELYNQEVLEELAKFSDEQIAQLAASMEMLEPIASTLR